MINKIRQMGGAAVITLLIGGCGGGGGDGPNPDNLNPDNTSTENLGREVAEKEFSDSYPDHSGTWIASFKMMHNYSMTIDGVSMSVDTNALMNIGYSEHTNTIDGKTYNLCQTRQDYTDSSIDSISGSISGSFIGMDCQSTATRFFINDNTYTILSYCNNKEVGMTSFTKINNTTPDFGSLSFTSNQYPSLDSSDGVCGGITETDIATTVSPVPNKLDLTSDTGKFSIITIHSPYADTSIDVELHFYTGMENMAIKNYTVSKKYGVPGTVTAKMRSTKFGVYLGDPVEISATDGNVNITAITETSASGTFDLFTAAGDRIEGNFSFDLK